MLGALIILSAAIFAVLSRGSISGGIVGLSITYALQVMYIQVQVEISDGLTMLFI